MKESGLPTPADATKTNDLARRAAPLPDPTLVIRHQADRVHELLVPSDKRTTLAPSTSLPNSSADAPSVDTPPHTTSATAHVADISGRPATRAIADTTGHRSHDDSISKEVPPPQEFTRIQALGYQISETTNIPPYPEVREALEHDPLVAQDAPENAWQLLETLAIHPGIPRPEITHEQYISVASKVLEDHGFSQDALDYATTVALPALIALHTDHQDASYTGAVESLIEYVTQQDLPRTRATLQEQTTRAIDFVEKRPQIIDAVYQIFADWVEPRAADEVQTNIVGMVEMGSYPRKDATVFSDIDVLLIGNGEVSPTDYEAFTTYVRERLDQIDPSLVGLEVWSTRDDSPTFPIDDIRELTTAADYVTTISSYQRTIIARDIQTQNQIEAALESVPINETITYSDPPINTATVQKLIRRAPLRRKYQSHGRSFPLNAQQAKELGLVVPRGDISDISIKGLPDETPYVRFIPTEDDFRIERVVQVSEVIGAQEKQTFLQANGLPTETYVSFHPLTEVPDPLTKERYAKLLRGPNTIARRENLPPGITIDEWKASVQEQLDYLRTHSYEDYKNHFGLQQLIQWPTITPDDINRLSHHIADAEFVGVLRTQPVTESFVDLQERRDIETAEREVLEKVFAYINRKRNGSRIPEGGFDITNSDHIRSFFQEFLPVNMAEYLANLHNLGLVHGWAHGQNWKLAVFLIDPETIHGIPFGDPAPTIGERRDDVQKSIDAIDMLLNFKPMGFYSLPSHYDSYIAKKFCMDDELRQTIERERFVVIPRSDDQALVARISDMRKEMICQFVATYLKQRGGLRPSNLDDRVRRFLDRLDLDHSFRHRDLEFSQDDYQTKIVSLLRKDA